MAKENDWWTSPTESESGKLIMVTGRRDVDKFMKNPRFNIRVEVSWKYDGDSSGMPDFNTSSLMEKAQEAIEKYGVCKGSWLAIRRLLRCNPFYKGDPFDPVP